MHWLAGLIRGAAPPVPVGPNREFRAALAAASGRGLAGSVLLALDIDSQGGVVEARVVGGRRDASHGEAAVSAARLLQFRPGLLRGEPVAFSGLRFGVHLGGAMDLRRRSGS